MKKMYNKRNKWLFYKTEYDYWNFPNKELKNQAKIEESKYNYDSPDTCAECIYLINSMLPLEKLLKH